MSVLDRFEKSVEGAVNGVFAKFGSKDLQPVDLSSALEREIDAEAILKATQVDGIYDSDPRTNPDAAKFDEISYMEVLSRELHVMDSTATTLCMDNDIPIIVFNLHKPGNIDRVLKGEHVGTTVS